MFRLVPAGSGGAGREGGGRCKVVRARTTAVEGPASRWPITVLTPATPTAARPVIRNRRRPGCGPGAADAAGGPEGSHEVPGGGGTAAGPPAPAAGAAAGAAEPSSFPGVPGWARKAG